MTATLPLCETSATGPGSAGASASPHSAARAVQRDDPVAVGPADRQLVAARGRRRSSRLAARRRRAPRAKPAAKTTAPPQPSAPASLHHRGTSAAGIATTTASGASGQLGERREARRRRARRLARRVDARTRAPRSRPLEVEQRLAAVRRPGAPWRPRPRPTRGAQQRAPRSISAAPARRRGARASGRRSAAGSRSCPPRCGRRAARAEALGDVGARVAAAAEHLHARGRRSGTPPRCTNSFAIDAFACTIFGSAPASASRATSSPSSRPAAASAAESASGNETPWWSISRAPPCSRADRPRGRLLEQPPHRADRRAPRCRAAPR